MPRPFKKRKLPEGLKEIYFKPAGIRKKDLDLIILNEDEYHAIKMIYIENLSQNESAQKMKISQPTFSRILNSGIKKMSESIINYKAIQIKKI
jgi:predicted DNA-binding protein (UPF0251 family)